MYANDAYIYDFGKTKPGRLVSKRKSERETELNRKKIIWLSICSSVQASSSFFSLLIVFNSSNPTGTGEKEEKKGDLIFLASTESTQYTDTQFHSSSFTSTLCISLSLLTILFRHHANRRSLSFYHSSCVLCVCVYFHQKTKGDEST